MNTRTSLRDLITTDLTTIRLVTLWSKNKSPFDTNPFHHLPIVDKMTMIEGVISKYNFSKKLRIYFPIILLGNLQQYICKKY